MDRLFTMSTFVKVVQSSSLTAAGSELGISRALVSRHIIDLEAYLGVQLLTRTTRAVTTTEAGQQYYQTCLRVLEEVRDGEDAIKSLSNELQGNISMITPKWVGYLEISAALAEFSKRYPKITIQLSLGGVSRKTYDFLDRGFDIAFQTKHIRDSNVKVKKIADIACETVASPAYLAEFGAPEHPDDLKNHHCLMLPSEPIWRFMEGDKVIPIKISPRFTCNSYAYICIEAVNDLGIAIMPRRVAAEALAAGKLVSILKRYPLETRPFYVAYAPGRNMPKKIRVLLTFLGEWFKQHPLS